LVLVQIPLESGHPIGTIRDLAHRTDLTLITQAYEVDELKWSLGARARPYTGFYLRRSEYGSIVELYGFHEHTATSSIFAIEPERRRKRYEQ
jgi:hypothetical protein